MGWGERFRRSPAAAVRSLFPRVEALEREFGALADVVDELDRAFASAQHAIEKRPKGLTDTARRDAVARVHAHGDVVIPPE